MYKSCAKNWKLTAIALSCCLLGAFEYTLIPSCAADPQEIMGSNGDNFMEEVSPTPKPRRQGANARANIINGDGTKVMGTTHLQSVQNPQSGMFMEEVDAPGSTAKPRKAYVDLSNVGIQVDPSGNAVPLIDHSGTPVRPIYSNTQAFQEMPVPIINPTYDNPLALPYAMDGQPAAVGTAFVPVTPGTVPFLRPSYNPYNGVTTLNPYSTNPNYYGYRPGPYYGGYPGGYGYGGYGGRGLNFNLGKLNIGLGGGGPVGYPGYGYNGFNGYNPGTMNNGLGYSPFGYSPRAYGSGLLGYNPGYGLYSPGNPLSGGLGNGFGGGGIGSGFGNSLSLPMPTQKTYSSSSTGSTLITPVLRDPATSTGDLLEDAKRAGLWSNTAGSSSGVYNQGLLGGSYKGTTEQHDTGITDGPGTK